jgi:hypothetical protein
MEIKKYLFSAFSATLCMAALVSCSDDETDGNAPRLFRPVATLEVSSNNIITTWENIKEATSYELSLYRVTGTDEADNNTYELVQTAVTNSSPYTWKNLNWDEKYKVVIKCANASKSSLEYETTDVNVNYLSGLTTIKFIDSAVRLSWKTDGDVIRSVKVVPTTDTTAPTVTAIVNSADFAAGYIDVYGLQPETAYSVYAYKDSETQDNSTYAGRMSGSTKAVSNFDEKYGAGMWIDIRSWDEKEAKDTLKSEVFWANVPAGTAIILKGEQDYKVNNSIKFNGSYTFVTGPTLGGNARFISSGGLTCASGAQIDKLQFEDIDFISDKAMPEGGNEVATNTDKGFGGRQVFNNNGTNAVVKELVFKNCTMTGYRAIVRTQKDNDAIQKVSFKGCTINGVGDQGVVTTTNKAADWQDITFDDCTITNIVMLCDMRATAGDLTFTVKNCTFCYAPIETTANKNTPLFRFGTNNVTLNISNTFFGPSLASTGSTGDDMLTYQAGTAGSILLDNQAAPVSASHSFKTKYDWTIIAEATYPIDGLTELEMTETDLWKAPAEGDFTVIGNVGESGIGPSKWQQ